jgi:hypothetical protein
MQRNPGERFSFLNVLEKARDISLVGIHVADIAVNPHGNFIGKTEVNHYVSPDIMIKPQRRVDAARHEVHAGAREVVQLERF